MPNEFIPPDERLLAQQRATLMEMWYSLDPRGRLETIAALTGDAAVTEFLRDLARSESENDKAMAILRTDAQARGVVNPKHLPRDAEVELYLCQADKVNDCETAAAVINLPHDRFIAARYLGGGLFKILAEDLATGLVEAEDEYFAVDDEVRLGAAHVSQKRKGRRTIVEDVCRYNESLGVTVDERAMLLTGFYDNVRHDLVLSCLVVNEETVLPYLGSK